jgi:two-component system cell cycle sensor histidine kinase/response regulator CckA
MQSLDSLVQSQLKRLGDEVPNTQAWRELLKEISDAYRESESRREALERSLALKTEELRETRETFRQQEEHFGYVMQATRDAIYDWDVVANKVWRNKTYQTVYGAVGTERQWWLDHVHPEDLPRLKDGFDAAFRDKLHFWSDEYRIRKPDGSYATVMDRGYIIFDADGKPLRKIGAITDLTAHKQVERELSASQALYHSFVEHMPASVFRKDYEGRYVFVNAMFCRLKNLKAEEILGKTPAELAAYESNWIKAGVILPSRQGTLLEGEEHHQLILRTGKPIEVEETYTLPDGTVEHFHVVKSPVFGPDGQVIGSQGIQFDITARKRAEEELFKSQQMLRTILDTIPQRVFWKDKNSVYVGCNKPLANDYGYDNPEELIGKTDFQTQSAATAELYRADDLKVMENGRAKMNFEEPQIKADGSVGWLRTSKVPLYGPDNRVIGVLGTYEDISERKRLEEQLRQAQKMDAFGQLAAGVAHDFNNLLTVILGNLSLLRMGLESKADEAAAIDQTVAASERAASLTRQLLMFGRRQVMQPKPLDLNKVVENMTKMLKRLIGEHITLEARCAPDSAPVLADANMMEQVLINLAVNSRDAMPKGGKLVIEIAAVAVDDPPLEIKHAGEFIRCTVTDSGAGIAPKNLPHIFEPFFTTKDVGKGTGLGLATVFGIVQQHSGWIKVESIVGQGTTFRIYLPRLAGDAPAQPEAHPAIAVRGGQETILLVEDEIPVRQLMHALLTHHGYKIHEASSGSEALKLWPALREKVDLLITDMVMPDGLTGTELADKLTVEKPDLKVIYCSGYTNAALSENSALRNNPNFLEKPFGPQKLLQRVRDCLDGH